MRWIGLTFKNIQSWESGHIPLNPDGLTVITAPSETGKSVYIKCLRIALFFKRIHPDDRKAIIREGYKEGYLEIELEDHSKVKLIFRPTTFEVELNDNGIVSSWREFFPNEIKERLGLIVNADLQLILNLMDQESPMLFDSTSNEYNDEILGFYANHDDLIHRFDVLSEWESNVSSSISNKKSTLKYIEEDMKRIPIIDDVDELESQLEYCEKLNDYIKYVGNVVELLDNVLSLEDGVDCTCDKGRSLFSQLELVDKLLSLSDNILQLDDNFADIDLNNAKGLFTSLSFVYTLIGINNRLDSLEPPSEKLSLTNASNHLTSLHYLYNLDSLLEQLLNLDDNFVESKDNHYKTLYSNLEYLVDLNKLLVETKKCLDDLDNANTNLLASRNAIVDLRKQFKVCALCGSMLE